MKYLKTINENQTEIDICDILFSLTDCNFKCKLSELYSDKIPDQVFSKKLCNILFVWCDSFDGIDEDLLAGLYKYENRIKSLYNFNIFRISFVDQFVFIILTDFYNLNELPIRFIFIEEALSNNGNVLRELEKISTFNFKHFKHRFLSSGINHQNGDNSNLCLFDWKYDDYTLKK